MLVQTALVFDVWFCRGGEKCEGSMLSVPMLMDGRWSHVN